MIDLLARKIIKKRVLVALFFLLILTSCSQECCRWKLECNQAISPHFCSSRLYLSPQDQFLGLELDLINTPYGQYIYINTFGIELQSKKQSPDGYPLVEVSIQLNQELFIYDSFLLQGGQRILLSDEAANLIIRALHEDRSFEIRVGNCASTITPGQFCEYYSQASVTL